MTTVVRIIDLVGTSGFAEDKDAARKLRIDLILPALGRRDELVLDFEGILFATQSFVHALIGEALKKHGEASLDRLEFRNCSTQLQSLIELVVDYSIGGFPVHEQRASTARSAR